MGMMSIAQRRQQLEEQQRQELLRLQEEEAQLKRLKEEVRSGDGGLIPEVASLRKDIEGMGRQMQAAERELDKRREVMRRATDAYVEAEERLAGLRKTKQEMEQKMLDTLLDIGKKRDAKLNEILTKI